PDLYISNDVAPNDVLYINNGDGTFTDRAGAWLKHTSFAGMGVDIADFNNDGWPDILQVDMMPAALDRRKRMSGYLTEGGRMELRHRGFRDDYDVNSLQMSNGVTNNGAVMFSEIAHLAGLAFTDNTTARGMDQPGYSYGAAYADLNNDGRLDLVVNNIDAPAFIYENVAPKDDAHHYLEIKLAGESPNRSGIGSTLILTAGGQKQYIYQSPYRGYTSTVDDR